MKNLHLIEAFTCATLITTVSLATENLGPAEGFTVFTVESFQANDTICTGRVAVGGPATYNNVGIGYELSNSNGERDDLIVAGNLTWITGDNFNGNIQVAGSSNLQDVTVQNGTIGGDVPIDFELAKVILLEISDVIFAIPSNGQTSKRFDTLTLTGSHETLNTFTVTRPDLMHLVTLTIDVPEGSSVIVNFDFNTTQLRDFEVILIGCEPKHVLFNLHETIAVQLDSLQFKGTILAPAADVHFNEGKVNGAIVCRSIQGNGETYHAPFVGYCICDCHDDETTVTCPDCDCNNPNSDILYD